MANNKRTFGNVAKGIWVRICLSIASHLYPAQLRNPWYRMAGVKIGKGSKIGATVDIDHSVPELITIGKNVWVTRGVMLLCHQRYLAQYEVGKPVMDCDLVFKPIVIKDGAHIGIGAIIMPGVTIGEGAVIGAGAVVTHDIPAYSVAVGVPARVMKTFVQTKDSNKIQLLKGEQIERVQWRTLVQESKTGTWFQSPEAYDFFSSLPDIFEPFVVGVERVSELANEGMSGLRGVCVGYITKERNPLKQLCTRRAIITGGPCLADDATDEEVTALMSAVHNELKSKTIYVETRNFNDYSKWKSAFAMAGFEYKAHLNLHVDTGSVDIVESNLGKSRKRDIKTTIREGVVIRELENEGVRELERERMVHEYYLILKHLYKKKVKTPLFPESFFQALAKHPNGRILLTELNGKIIGGTVCVEQANKCIYEWFACGKDGVYPHVFPSSYATYAGIRYAAEHDCPRFDMMGAGTPTEAYGVRDFKSKFGGKEVEHGRFLVVNNLLIYQLGTIVVKILKRI